MTDPWLPILANLSLSRAEQAAVKRFQQDPEGRTFLPVADILRSHDKIDESLEMLVQGVERHPTFAVARVVLARELFAKGMVAQALLTLEDSPVSLADNLLAQKLRFRCALLAGAEDLTRQVSKHMHVHQMFDEDTKKLADLLMVSSFAKTRDHLVTQMTAKGLKLTLPEPGDLHDVLTLSLVDEAAVQESPDDDEAVRLSERYLNDEGLRGFHVVPLGEIFQGELQNGTPGTGGVELDSTTLADIYARQGHYGKALAIYRRLLRLTPNNEFLQRKAQEYTKLEKEQRADDLAVDPTVVDQLEALEILDSQASFYNTILSKLDSQ